MKFQFPSLPPRVEKFLSGGMLFTIQTMIGVAVGIGLGLGLGGRKNWADGNRRDAMYLKFVGDLFLRALGAMILPLIVSSLIDAVGSLDLSISKKIGTRALIFYLGTTAIAAVLGIVLGVVVRPGDRASPIDRTDCDAGGETSTVDTLLDLVRNVLPPNLIGATIETTQTTLVYNASIPDLMERNIDVGFARGTNMLGLVVFSIMFGVVLGGMGENGKPVLNFFKSLGEASMIIIQKVVAFSPIAICFLIAAQLVVQDDPGTLFKNLAWYFGTVMLGLLIHGFLILPGLYILLTRTNPIPFFMNMMEALTTAFGTASSSATLPITMRCLEEKNGVDIRVSRFVIPIGATVNMNGTALYLPVGAIYIAQLCGTSLGIGQLITISLISIATSVGAAGIPQVGMVILMTVMGSVGLPINYISFILPIDWLLERFRTAVNVLGDSIGAGIVAEMCKDDLAKAAQLEEVSVVDPETPPPTYGSTDPSTDMKTK